MMTGCDTGVRGGIGCGREGVYVCAVGCGGLAWEGRGYALQWLDRLQMCMDRLRGAVWDVVTFKI